MSKPAIKVPPAGARRPVRLTLEVSADTGTGTGARKKRRAARQQPATPASKPKRPPSSHRSRVAAEAASSPAPAKVRRSAAAAVPTPPVEPARGSTPVGPPPAPSARRRTGLQALGLAGAAALVATAIALPQRSTVSEGSAPAQHTALPVRTADVALSPAVPAAVPSAPGAASRNAIPRRASGPATASVSPTVASRLAETERVPAPSAASPWIDTPVAKAPVESVPEPAEPPAATSVSRAVSSGSVAPPVTTVTGCLEMSDDERAFRLSDTDGTDAPKARSWRTGFLRKRSSSVALVAPADRSSLETNVGKRVAATGMLAGRELKLSSLRVVGPSCD